MTDAPSREPASPATTGGSLSTWDMVSLIVGIVVGVSIFRLSPSVFANAGGPVLGLAVWVAGAGIALCGALCYSELAAAYPRFGAEYVYLSRAYGRRTGLMFAWMQTFAVITGNVGAMAFILAEAGSFLISPAPADWQLAGLAILAVLTSLVIHCCGLRVGRFVQNAVSVAKILSLLAVLVCGLLVLYSPVAVATAPPPRATFSSLGLALVFVMYAYGGWNDATSVAPEVRDCRRNVPQALVIGVGLVAILYLAVNFAYLMGLGYPGLVSTRLPAADVVGNVMGGLSARIVRVMIMICAFGALHGLLFTGCRLLRGVSEEVPLLAPIGRFSTRGVPVVALPLLAGISIALILLVGTESGRDLATRAARFNRLPQPQFAGFGGGFDLLFAASAPIFNFFYVLAALSLFILRVRDPDRPRPFRVPGYPVTPVIFLLAVCWLLWSSIQYAGWMILLLSPIAVAGGFLAVTARLTDHREAATLPEEKQRE